MTFKASQFALSLAVFGLIGCGVGVDQGSTHRASVGNASSTITDPAAPVEADQALQAGSQSKDDGDGADLDVFFNDHKKKISLDLIGTNLLYNAEKDAIWKDGHVADLLENLNVGYLRYPGGELTSSYHWNDLNGNGFKDSWDPKNKDLGKAPASEWMGVDEYLEQLKNSHAKPLLGVNVQSGHNFPKRHQESLDEAVALVKHVKHEGFAGATYFIDNEAYAKNASMDVETYAAYVNEYADRLRQEDGDIKIVANWQNKIDGLESLLNVAGRNIDYVDFHFYWNADDADFKNWRGHKPMTHENGKGMPEITYTDKIAQFRGVAKRVYDKKAAEKKPMKETKLAAFEWSLGPTKSTVKPSHFETAIICAEMFMQFVQGDLDAAAVFPLHFDPSTHPDEVNHATLQPATTATTAEELDDLHVTPMY